ncbi:MAG: glycosyltransferase family 39 protein, partial [Acidobacteriaceae bacterium]|nr:glycosyltransferase family 39 protein [Acidobacteriaceae bacterium]
MFSILYFSTTLLRASEKRLWYDEICTLYICRLPTFGEAWAAVLHGADYNPPLFYVLQRAGMSVFGDGLIAMRLPAMIMFWVLCLCLFFVARRRAGFLAGWTAMLLPLITGAYFYSYEARPHGMVLGFCALALLCWQRIEEDPSSYGWLLGFSLSILAASLTHCYAVLSIVPFALAETVHTFRLRTVRWRIWAAFIAPALIAAAFLIPLLKSYKTMLQSAGFSDIFVANPRLLPMFYSQVLQSSLLALIALTALLAFSWTAAQAGSVVQGKVAEMRTRAEIALTIGFIGMPFYGLVIARLGKGPFIVRYFMSAVIGIALAVALCVGLRLQRRYAWLFVLLLTCFAG